MKQEKSRVNIEQQSIEERIETVKRNMIYVTSDIHGCYDALQKLLDTIKFSDTDTLYIVGDVIDRGPTSLETLYFVRNTKNIKLLLGNHEEFLLECFKTIWKKEKSFVSLDVWLQHGGEETYQKFLQLSKEEQKEMVEYLSSCPVYQILDHEQTKKVVLVHAGIKPNSLAATWEELMGQQQRNTLLWVKEEFLCQPFEVVPEGRLIFGHTPTCEIQRIRKEHRRCGMVWKDGKRWGIDGGYLFGGHLICLRLDDWKEYYI